MSRLLPIDLVNANLPTSLRGYRPEDVDKLLDRAARALEDLTAENEELRGQIARMRNDLDEMRQEERLVKEAIVSAQRAAESLRADAMREADLIREEARQLARVERSQSQREATDLKEEVEQLKTLRKRYLAEHRAILERSLRELDELDARSAPASAVVQIKTPIVPVGTPTIIEDETGEKWVQ